MIDRQERLRAAVLAFHRWPSARSLRSELNDAFLARASDLWRDLDDRTRSELTQQVDALLEREVDVVFTTDAEYPASLASLKDFPPILFTIGSQTLLNVPSVGMCGSRHVSPKGLEAARVCGIEVARNDLAVVSGYARGVDTETHLAALRSDGRTIIVLAEGILHFRKKRSFQSVDFDSERVLIVSQLPPGLAWNPGSAMTRNAIIAALGKALVVIEAGATGGTLDAGKKAIKMGRPVLALQFSDGTPEGNQLLFNEGAIPIKSTVQLSRVINAIGEAASVEAEQLTIL